MSEEIKIVVKQVTEGTALRDATDDAKKLAEANKAAAAPSGKPSTPTPASPERIAEIRETRRKREAADAAGEARRVAANEKAAAWNARPMEGENGKKAEEAEAKAAEDEKRKSAAADRQARAASYREQRNQIEGLKSEAIGYRAKGDSGFAEQLEKEAAIRKESLRVQMQTGAAEAEATVRANEKFAA